MCHAEFTMPDFVKSIGSFVDTIWEIDCFERRAYVWRAIYADIERREYDLDELVSLFSRRFIYGPDCETFINRYTPAALSSFLESDATACRFELRLVGEPFGFQWHDSCLQKHPRMPGRLFLLSQNATNLHRSSIVESAVRSEYDLVIYLEADKNSYVMYSANPSSGTPLPPVTLDDYTAEMIRYNTAHVADADRERLIKEMQLPRILEQLDKYGEHVLFHQIIENGVPRDKKMRFSYFDSARNIVLLTRTDITAIREEKRQKKLLQDALNAATVANRAKSEFLSRMSHDIRTPMNAIIGMTAIAGAHISDQERVLDCLGKITVSSKLLLSLINEVLDMSKIESGRITLNEEEFHLGDLCQGLVTMVQPDISAKGHQFDVHVQSIRHETVIGDIQRIQQTFINLLSNAIKYTPQNGRIVFEIAEKACRVPGYACYEFVVEDNGIGMKPDFLPRLFDPFERADDQEIQRIQGTGLGMAISRNLVQMMNGDIQVNSEYGHGTRFTVTMQLALPQNPDDGGQASGGEFPEAPESIELPVLITDDDPVVCESTCLCLNEIGMRGEWALSGEDAIQKVIAAHQRGQDYFAAIIDLKMPGMDGIETARQIRNTVGPDIPILMLSAYDWSEYENEARAAGVNGFILKPMFKSRLAYALRRYAPKSFRGQPDSSAPLSPQLDALPEEDYSRKRILLVEDNELNMEIAQELLRGTGVKVDTAENGAVAVEKFTGSPIGYYDLIFMDIQMPVMNGNDAAKAIRALRRADAATVPIVAMTANAFDEDVRASREAGMNEHTAKPINIKGLLEVLNRWLSPGKPLA